MATCCFSAALPSPPLMAAVSSENLRGRVRVGLGLGSGIREGTRRVRNGVELKSGTAGLE
eukprot:scaffold103981_cov21-Phaeocystis_antarctica.AAC.1